MASKVKCSFCKNYVPKDKAIRSGVQSFCSSEHKLAKANEYSKPTPKKNDPSDDLKQEVRDLDGNRCRFCGRSGVALHVHHVLYRSEGGEHDVGNLLTLCNDCHNPMVHANKDLWQPLCLRLIELRTKTGDKLTLVPQLRRKYERENRNSETAS
jgi:hypothetical protein